MRPTTVRPTLPALMLVAGLLLACGDDGTGPDGPPGHTVVRDGVAHAPGLEQPNESCAECHGADLRGGDEGEPSCYSCHGAVWT